MTNIREALEEAIEKIEDGAQFGAANILRRLLAADDAARGTMQLTGDQARAIAQSVATSASDPVSPMEYVRAGWQAASRAAAPQAQQPLPDHDNHHNALKCPYCNPNRWVLVPPEAAAPQSVEPVAWRYRDEKFCPWVYVDGPRKPTWPWKTPECEGLYLAPPAAPTDAGWPATEQLVRIALAAWVDHQQACRFTTVEGSLTKVCGALRAHIATRPLPAPPTDSEWLFIAMDDDGRAHLTYCADRAAVRAAVVDAVWASNIDADDAADNEQADGITETLIEDGEMRFEGDPPLYLFRLPAPPTKKEQT